MDSGVYSCEAQNGFSTTPSVENITVQVQCKGLIACFLFSCIYSINHLGFGLIATFATSDTLFKGSDRLCKVGELRMQCCQQILSDSFETYFTF